MNEPERSNEPQDDSLEKAPPTPVETTRGTGPGSFALGAVVFLLGAAALFVLLAPLIPAQPATRSEQLEMERRSALIEQAAQEVAASTPANANSGEANHASTSHAGND